MVSTPASVGVLGGSAEGVLNLPGVLLVLWSELSSGQSLHCAVLHVRGTSHTLKPAGDVWGNCTLAVYKQYLVQELQKLHCVLTSWEESI